ncbi:FAD-dependent thymidylate synthase [Elusimicrobiota bacterium]
MKIYLAGYNVDTVVLSELKEKYGDRTDITPEVISAAYARISRDPRSINEIRKDARLEVERTRKSNETIIFKMGHHSVAEHAVFNLDIVGLSRLAMEELEKFRLSSFTEKSQRYITLDKDFVIPEEIKNTPLEKEFVDIVHLQNNAYHEYYGILKSYVFKKYSELASDPKKHNLLEGWAKEDARYITALATESQVGLTVNARNLELMLRRFASSSLSEIRELGSQIYSQISEVAPSVVLFHQANDKDVKTYPELKKLLSGKTKQKSQTKFSEVKLVDYTKMGDDVIAASLMHTSSNMPFDACLSSLKKMSNKAKADIFKTSFSNMQFYDSALREFEYANLTYNVVLSSACFGQLKRHRMSTITSQPYDISLGITIPESIKEIGKEKHFKEIILKTEKIYAKMLKDVPLIAPYILTNAHRKRVLIRLNAREMCHISRLREDAHAQWDIRNISSKMSVLAKKAMPLTFMMLCGKDKYNETYQKVFSKSPKIIEAVLPGARKIKEGVKS